MLSVITLFYLFTSFAGNSAFYLNRWKMTSLRPVMHQHKTELTVSLGQLSTVLRGSTSKQHVLDPAPLISDWYGDLISIKFTLLHRAGWETARIITTLPSITISRDKKAGLCQQKLSCFISSWYKSAYLLCCIHSPFECGGLRSKSQAALASLYPLSIVQ